jgi:hypothetical protein
MRAVRLILLLTALGWADDVFGTWKMNPARSTVAGDPAHVREWRVDSAGAAIVREAE